MNEDLKTGIAIALCSRGRRFAKPTAEPVAFLYNGVRLPDIYSVYTPELQKTHPFTHVIYGFNVLLGETHYYGWLYLVSSVDFTIFEKSGNWCLTLPSGSKRAYVQSVGTDSFAGCTWGEFEQIDNEGGRVVTDIAWSNFDVLNEDGTVYLPASIPVPVYE